ncbi:MAG: hypothetical protein FJW32_24280, partial [Acidobacteria bacterium]|nr:hypothetical protein [Acidobacteriota bacterium]
LDIAIAGSTAIGALDKGPQLSELEQDLISALVNLGSQRANAEAAVRKAKAALPDGDFESLLRKAMEAVR